MELFNARDDDCLICSPLDPPFHTLESFTYLWYSLQVLVPFNAFPFTYKFAVVDKMGTVLEKGESRLASLPLCK